MMFKIDQLHTRSYEAQRNVYRTAKVIKPKPFQGPAAGAVRTASVPLAAAALGWW